MCLDPPDSSVDVQMRSVVTGSIERHSAVSRAPSRSHDQVAAVTGLGEYERPQCQAEPVTAQREFDRARSSFD
jgi:hypothetical protein